MAEGLQPIQFRAAWIGIEDVPIVLVNQVVGQLDDHGDAILSFGQASPPVLTGTTPEEQAAEAAAVPFIQVRPVSRVTLSSKRLEGLIILLQQLADKQKEVRQALEENSP